MQFIAKRTFASNLLRRRCPGGGVSPILFNTICCNFAAQGPETSAFCATGQWGGVFIRPSILCGVWSRMHWEGYRPFRTILLGLRAHMQPVFTAPCLSCARRWAGCQNCRSAAAGCASAGDLHTHVAESPNWNSLFLFLCARAGALQTVRCAAVGWC